MAFVYRTFACLVAMQAALVASDSRPVKQHAVAEIGKLLAPNSASPAADATITAPPSFVPRYLHRRQNNGLAACTDFQTYLRCDGEFTTPYALCACYTAGTYAPAYIDGLAVSCSNHLQSVSGSSAASPFASFATFCSSVGDVASSLSSTVRSCESSHSGNLACATDPATLELYGTLSAKAACACYSGNLFSGSRNDKWASTCYSKASLAGTSFTAEIREYTALCTSLGDVRASAQDLSANCGQLETVLSSCSSETARFGSLPSTEQASCLCYSGSDWIVAEADNAAATCLQYASANFQHRVSLYSPYEGLCSAAGDVRPAVETTQSGQSTTSPEPSSRSSVGGPTSTGSGNSDPTNNPSGGSEPQQTDGSGNGSGLSGGALAGVIVGAIAGTALLIGAGVLLFLRSRKAGSSPLPPPAGYGGMDDPVGGIEPDIGGIAEKNEPQQNMPIPPPPWMAQSRMMR
ncbi:hypothetical protein ABW20_dc0103605 [Dactylellina cionopaga]|nr:hypothetical protein ABW20_dc0103605 [Dactylellina cionopaga]